MAAPPRTTRRPARRVATRVLAGIVGLGALVFVGLVGVGLWLRTPGGREWLLRTLLGLADPPHGTLVVEDLETDLFSGATLRGVSIRDDAGRELLSAEQVEVEWRLAGLPGKVLRVPRAEVTGLRADLAIGDEGLDLALLWDTGKPPSGEPYQGLPIDLLVDEVRIDAPRVRLKSGDTVYGLDDGRIRAGLAFRGDRIEVTGIEVDAGTFEPALGDLALRGGLTYDPDSLVVDGLDLTVGPQRLQANARLGRLQGEPIVGLEIVALHLEPDALPWDLPVHGAFDATGSINGLLEAPAVALNLETPGGPLVALGRVDLREDPPTWTLTTQPRGVRLDAFLDGVEDTTLEGTVVAEGKGFSWPDGMEAKVALDATASRLEGKGPVHAVGEIRLAKGVADVDRLEVTAPGGKVRLGGRVEIAAGRALAQVQGVDVDLAELAVWGVPGLVGTARFSGTVDAGWGERTTVRAVGTLTGNGVGYGQDVVVAALAGPVDAAWGPGGATLDAVLDLTEVRAPETSLATARVELTGTASPEGVVAATGTVGGTTLLAGPVSVSTLDAKLDVTSGPGGALAGQIGLATGPVRVDRYAGDRATATATIDGRAVTLDLDVFDGARTLLGVDATADLDRQAFAATRLRVAPTADFAWEGQGTQTLRLVEGGVEDVRLRLASGDARVEVDGALRMEGRSALTAHVVGFDLGTLAQLQPDTFAGWAGRVDLDGAVEGSMRRPTVSLTADAKGLSVPDAVRSLDARLVAEGRDDTLAVDLRAGPEDAPLLLVQGTVPARLDPEAPGVVPDGPLHLTVLLPPGDLNALDRHLGTPVLPPWRASGEVHLGGTPRAPRVDLVASVEAVVGETREHLRLDLDATTAGDRLALRVVARERMVRRAQVSGRAPVHLDRVAAALLGEAPEPAWGDPATWIGDVEVDLVPLQLPASVLVGMGVLPQGVRGDLSGGIALRGPPRAPLVSGGLLLLNGRVGDVPIDAANVLLVPAAGGYDLTVDVAFQPLPPEEGDNGVPLGPPTPAGVRVAGFVPFRTSVDTSLSGELARPGLDLEVSGPGLPLGAVAGVWPDLRDARGVVKLGGTVTGSIAAPRPDVTATLEGGAFSLKPTGVRYEDVAFAAAYDGEGVRVAGIRATTVAPNRITGVAERGTVEGAVNLPIGARLGGQAEGELRLDGAFLLDLPEARLRIDEGKLGIGGRVGSPEVRGSVRVAEASVDLGERFFVERSDLALHPDVIVHRPGMAPQGAEEERAEGRGPAGADGRAPTVASPVGDAVPLGDVGPRPLESAPAAPMPTSLQFRIDVDLNRNAFLAATLPLQEETSAVLAGFSTLVLEVMLDGQLRVGSPQGQLSVAGEVEPLRGVANLFGREFAIREGTVAFTGKDYTNPVLALVAVYDAGTYGEIEARIGGTPDSLEIALTSEDWPSTDDVLAILLFGRPMSEMGGGAEGGGQQDVLTALLPLVAGGAIGEAESAAATLPLDLVEIGEQSRVGTRLGSRVFLVVEYDAGAQERDESPVVVTVEVQLPGRFQLEAEAGSAGEAATSVRWRWKF